MDNIKPLPWHAIESDEMLAHFHVIPSRGLDDEEALKQRLIFGSNVIEKKNQWRTLKMIFGQISSPLVIILLVSAFLTYFLLDDVKDTLIILFAVLINTVIGVVQEGRADRAFETLKSNIQKKSRVMRNGIVQEISSEDLVPGDILELEAGMGIEADARVIEARRFSTNEASLTGEWIAQEKDAAILAENTPIADQSNMVFSGTLCQSGMARAVVVRTGRDTEIGKIAVLIDIAKETETPFQRSLAKLSRLIGVIVFFVSVFFFVIGILRGESFETMFLTSVALAVSAVPEGLPIAVTVILALGMERILKKGGLLKRLKSAETLGSTHVILSDKTGTITEGVMEVSHVVPISNLEDDKDNVLRAAVFAAHVVVENPDDDLQAWKMHGDAVDQAIIKAGRGSGIMQSDFLKEYELTDDLPFDSEDRFAGVIYKKKKSEEYLLCVIGAPEVVLERCNFSEHEKDKAEALYKELVSNGARVIASASLSLHKKPEGKQIKDIFVSMNLEGFIGFSDPIRKDTKEALKLAQEAGIRAVIVTGDHKLTAMRVAHELEFDGDTSHVMEGSEFEKGGVDVEHIDIFARVLPHQKLLIAEAWQKKGMTVAMTGDGVNDAPALKHADIGIALGSGTEVAKEAADLVLMNNSFATILAAIEEGRTIVDNLRKVITFLFATSFTAVVLIGGAFVFGLPLPLLPAQILWMNIVGEGFFNFAFAFEKKESDAMRRRPGQAGKFFTREMIALIFAGGLVSDFILLGVFLFMQSQGVALDVIRTLMFIGLALNSFFFVFSLRSLRRPIWQIEFFSNFYLLFAVVASVGLLLPVLAIPVLRDLLHVVPLTWSQFFLMVGLGFLDLVLIEAIKYFFIVRGKTGE